MNTLKKVWTRSLTAKITLLIVTFTLAICAQPQRRPQDIEELFRNFFIEYVQLRPETGTYVGIPSEWGIAVRNDALDDESENGVQKLYDLYRKYRGWLTEYDQDSLSHSQRIAATVLQWFLENELAGERFYNHAYTITPLYGLHRTFVSTMTDHHKISTVADAQNYTKRLVKFEIKVAQVIERMKKQQERRIIPPAYVVENYLQSLSEFVSVPCEKIVIYI